MAKAPKSLADAPSGADFARFIVHNIKDEDTYIAVDGDSSAEFDAWVDTGAMALNALISGSLYGGIANNKRLMIAGESSTGKTFFALSILKHFHDTNPTGLGIYYDTEAAVTRHMLTSRGIDPERVIIVEVNTVQQFRTHALRLVDAYNKQNDKVRPPMMMFLDSLGNLSTDKEVADSTEGKDTRDMTRAQLVRGTFRTLTAPLAKAKIPVVITNHVYVDVMGGPYAGNKISGGGGAIYAADTIITLTKAQDKASEQDKTIVGNIISVTTYKSRFTREKAKVKLRLSFDTGLDRHYGLVDIALRAGVFTKISTKIGLPDGSTAFEKAIYRNPDKYFTPDIMAQLEVAAGDIFNYGGKRGDAAEVDSDDLDEVAMIVESDSNEEV